MEQNTQSPRGRLVPTVLAVVLVGSALVVLQQWFVAKRQEAMRTSCLCNLKCIGTSINMYMSDWDQCYPLLRSRSQRAPKGLGWPQVLVIPTHRFQVHDPSVRHPSMRDEDHGVLLYSFNSRLSGQSEADTLYTTKTIMVFDSINDSPANNNLHGETVWHPRAGETPPVGSLSAWTKDNTRLSRSLPDWARPRHGPYINICCTDGHAAQMHGWDDQFTMSPK